MNSPAYAYDFETYLFFPGQMAPKYVCGSIAQIENGTVTGSLLANGDALPTLRALLESGSTVAFANAAYDLAVAAQADLTLRRLIFDALRGGRIHDVLLAQALDAIYHGTLGESSNGGTLIDPSTGKPSKRYSLSIVTHLVLGRTNAKDADAWRMSYAVLDGIPPERWPNEAREYPVHDARNTLEVAVSQVVGTPGVHLWEPIPQISGQPLHHTVVCVHCLRGAEESECAQLSETCPSAPAQTHKNLNDLPAQVEAAHALHLGACWSLRTDPAKVERLAAEVEKKHADAVERFQKKGWIRSPCTARCGTCVACRAAGTEDQAAVKRAIAIAYGASAPCLRCRGTGRVKNIEVLACRGEKVRGRYRGCGGLDCAACGGNGEVVKVGGERSCRDVVDENGTMIDNGCDGTGFDLGSVPMLPRTEKGGVSTDRDTTMESGDDDLSDFGENEFEKCRTTYIPWLRAGVDRPLKYSTNPLVGTGRCSYEGGPFHQLPRSGKERECIRARGSWCGHPVEMVLGSTDYEAGELVCLAQYTYWLFKYSQMRDAINRSGKPGILHSDLAAEVLGISLDEFLERLSRKDKQAKDFRQMSKCFHPDTEILTRRRGWVRIAELTMEDEVASAVPHLNRAVPTERQRDSLGRFPPASGTERTRAEWRQERGEIPSIEIVWTKPTALTKRKAETLLHLKNDSIDLRVTPDHRMLTYGSTNLPRVVEARDFGKQRGWFNAGLCKSGDLEVDERLLRLAVATQADGNYIINGIEQRHIKFGFSKQRKINRLSDLLRAGEYTRSVSSNGKNKPTTRFELSETLSTQVKCLLDSDKTLPWWWLELQFNLRSAALEEVAFWDSHRGPKMRCYYFSTSIKKNAEVLQALASITNRKATYLQEHPYETLDGEVGIRFLLSVKEKYDTRGENVKIEEIAYNSTVYCLSVPSTYVLVRDRGIPVITQQCINFGVPGRMGVPKLVLTSRKKNAGFTFADDGPAEYDGKPGYWGVRFCILTGNVKRCGVRPDGTNGKVTEWKKFSCPPVCEECLKVVDGVLKPAYFRRYPEIKDYFKWAEKKFKRGDPAPSAVWDANEGKVRVTRLRKCDEITAFCNNSFQAMLADIGKHAFCQMTREAYLGERNNGSWTPLLGARFPVFMHDEPISELVLETAHLSGPRIAEIAVEAGELLAPDVVWKAETAISFFLAKGMEPVYLCSKCGARGDKHCVKCGTDGKLVPWEPKGGWV